MTRQEDEAIEVTAFILRARGFSFCNWNQIQPTTGFGWAFAGLGCTKLKPDPELRARLGLVGLPGLPWSQQQLAFGAKVAGWRFSRLGHVRSISNQVII